MTRILRSPTMTQSLLVTILVVLAILALLVWIVRR